MDIFNYLMNKKGKNLFYNKKALSYLIGKNVPHYLSGTEIEIANGKNVKIQELKMTKESTQDGIPTPENPVEVNTVKGYRNLFDGETELGSYDVNNGTKVISSVVRRSANKIAVQPNTTYSLVQYGSIIANRMYYYNSDSFISSSPTSGTFTTPSNCNYVNFISDRILNDYDEIMIIEGEELKPYVPYGSNYIYTTISDGTNSKITLIPLNDNEICGIGDYKDELIIDKNGHCYLNKKIGKVVLNGSENLGREGTINNNYRFNVPISVIFKPMSVNATANLLCDKLVSKTRTETYSEQQGITPYKYSDTYYLQMYIEECKQMTITEFKAWLSSNNLIVYAELETPTLIDLNYTVDLTLYSGTNTITNSEDMDMYLIYHY